MEGRGWERETDRERDKEKKTEKEKKRDRQTERDRLETSFFIDKSTYYGHINSLFDGWSRGRQNI